MIDMDLEEPLLIIGPITVEEVVGPLLDGTGMTWARSKESATATDDLLIVKLDVTPSTVMVHGLSPMGKAFVAMAIREAEKPTTQRRSGMSPRTSTGRRRRLCKRVR